MGYFNYHACAKKLLREGKLIGFKANKDISGNVTGLILFFNDLKHPVMSIKKGRVCEYLPYLLDEIIK